MKNRKPDPRGRGARCRVGEKRGPRKPDKRPHSSKRARPPSEALGAPQKDAEDGIGSPAVEGRDSEDDDEDYEMTDGGRSDGADGETTDGDHSDVADDHDWPGAHVSWDGFWNFGAEDDPRLARPGSMWVSGYVAEDDPLEHRGKVFPRGPEAPPGGEMV